MKRWQIILLLLAVAYGVAVALARPLAENPWDAATADIDRPLVMAHQGGDGLRPSNTMVAFANAVDLGVDVLEMDIHSTADGVLVVIHDSTVDRTTDGTGEVHSFSFAELQTLDAGYNWPTLYEDDSYPFRGQGITIPALEEVLTTYPDMLFNIEIKQTEPSIAQDLCDLLRKHDVADQTLVAAFFADTVDEFRAACPGVATSLSQGEVVPVVLLATFGLGPTYQAPGEALQIPEERFGLKVLKNTVIRTAQRKGVHVHAWTLNDTESIQRALDMNVDGIITDYPDKMLDALAD